MAEHDDLVRDLMLLGRQADVPPPSADLADAVLRRVAAPAPERWWTRQRRLVAVAVAAVALALLATPPVRAAVADWFGFSGVLVERDSSAPESEAPPPGAVPPGVTLAEAADRVDFVVHAPAELGPPDGVEVSEEGRLVSMSWTTEEAGVVRLDQFDGRLDYTMVKVVPDVSYATVLGSDAIWFDDAHAVTVLGADGTPVTAEPRLAGPTLVWPMGDTTLRLEGDLSAARAIEIGESVEPVG